jgi:hypothetical protein
MARECTHLTLELSLYAARRSIHDASLVPPCEHLPFKYGYEQTFFPICSGNYL